MQRVLLLFLLMTGLAICQAQERNQTLLQDLDITGAFGGPLMEIGEIAGVNNTQVGGGGALVLERLFFGGYGMGGTFDDVEVTFDNEIRQYDLKFRHGGLWFGVVPMQNKVIHPYISFKLGWGRGRLRQEGEDEIKDRVFVMTPELGLEVNVADFLKIAGTAGYRVVNGVTKLGSLDNGDFRQFFAGITFRIGGFDDYYWDW